MAVEEAASRYMYDQVMLGSKETLGKELFDFTYNGQKVYNPQDEELAVGIIRYAMEYYMGYTPDQTAEFMTPELLKLLHLDGLVNQRIRFPAELDPMDNMQYLLHLMYPDRFPYNEYDAVVAYYDAVLSGRVARFKKGFFSEDQDNLGTKRACICFMHMLQLAGRFSSYRDMYDFFNSKAGTAMISKYKLRSAYRTLFEYPIDFLHFSLPPKNRDEYYYQLLRFRNNRQKLHKKKLAEQREKKKATMSSGENHEERS